MKKLPALVKLIAIILGSIIADYSTALGQQCLSGGCSNVNNNYNPCVFYNTTNTSWNQVGTLKGGDYAFFNVVQGATYEWTCCSGVTGGGGQTGDGELTLFNVNTNDICYSNDCGLSSCPNAPYIRWTAAFSGQVRILASRKTTSTCQNTSGVLMDLYWRRTNSGTTPNTPSGFSSSSTSSSVTLSWNGVSGANKYLVYDCDNCDGYLGSTTTTSYTYSSLNPSTQYRLRVAAVSSSNCNSILSGCQNITTQSNCTSSSPTSQASNITFTNVYPDQMTVNWSAGNGDNRLLVAREGSAVSGNPVDNTDYTDDSWYGDGSPLGNGYVMYSGSGSSVTVGNLSPNTTYYFRVYEYNCSGGNSKFNTSTTSGNPTNKTTPCDASLNPSSNITVGQSGGSFSFNLDITGTCSWTAAVTAGASWITLTSPSSGTTSRTCNYTVSNNTTGTTRQGEITIAGLTFSITQPAPPIASFSANNQNIDAGDKVDFSDNSSNIPTSWQWTIQGGNPYVTYTSALEEPQIQFYNPGSYKVTLTASNSAGGNSKTINGFITVKPKAGIMCKPGGSYVIRETWNQKSIADPIQIATGTYIYKHTDIEIPGLTDQITFTRYYNSYNNTRNSPIGFGWSHSYNYRFENKGDSIWEVYYPDGHSASFIPLYNGNGTSFPLYGGTYDSLIKKPSAEYWMYTKEKHIYKFSSAGTLSQISKPNGNQTSLTYTSGRLTSIQISGGRSVTLAYNTNNRISSIQTPSGRSWKYEYDSFGNQTSAITARGDTTRFIYSPTHLLETIINPLGDTLLSNTYDTINNIVIAQRDAYGMRTDIAYNVPSQGDAKIIYPDNSSIIVHHDDFFRITEQKDALGKVSTVTYDDNSNPLTETNEKGQQTQYQYDTYGNPTVQILPGSRTYNRKFNEFSKLTELSTPTGQTTYLNYDNSGNLLSLHLADNSWRYFRYNTNGTLRATLDGNGDSTVHSYNTSGDLIKATTPTGNINYTYDADGRLLSVKDENGNTTSLLYDNNDNITRITDPLGKFLSFDYDKDNQLISSTDKKGYTTWFTYDKKGRIITKRNAMQGVDSFFYDAMDRVVKWRDANGHNTNYTYDANSRKLSTTNTIGGVSYGYDNIGNITKLTDQNNKNITLAYSPSNFISSVTDAVNHTNTMTYDGSGNMQSLTNYRNKTINYVYDSLNRLSSVLDVDNESTAYQYDLNGNLKSLTDGNGHTQNFSYGKSNRLTSYTDGAGNPYTLLYDSAGNVKKITKPVGSITNTYDQLHRLTRSVMSSGDTYNYTYDVNDNLTSIQNNTGTSNFYYDSLNRLTRYVDPFGKQVSYGYNAVGSTIYIIYSGTDTVHYAYDDANRLISVKDWKNTNPFTYTYDPVGNVTKLTYPNGAHCDYTYDAINRVTSKVSYLSSNAILYSQQYQYSSDVVTETRIGKVPTNLASTKLNYEYRGDDALLSDSVTTYINDNNGNRTQETTGADTIRYTYTADQLLASYKHGTANTTYSYDALGHRLRKTVGSLQTRYVLGLNGPLSLVLQTTDGTGKVSANYIYGLGLLEQIDENDSVLFYHFDIRHNTIAITDVNDSIKATYAYTLFGTVTNKMDSLVQPFTFLGEFGVEKESDSWYYIRARYYDANTGRFLSKDPLFGDEFDPQSLNRYVYAMNEPLDAYDISGLYGEKDFENGISLTDLTLNLLTHYYKSPSTFFKFLSRAAIVASFLSTVVSTKNIYYQITNKKKVSELDLFNLVVSTTGLSTPLLQRLGIISSPAAKLILKRALLGNVIGVFMEFLIPKKAESI